MDFVNDFLALGFRRLQGGLADAYPKVFLLLGNDDGRFEEAAFLDVAATGLWSYAHNRSHALSRYQVFGYAYVPPSPFLLKDWERYDVSRYVPPGCVSPEDGRCSFPRSASEMISPARHWADADGCSDQTGTPAARKPSATMRSSRAATAATSAKPRQSAGLRTPCRVPWRWAAT